MFTSREVRVGNYERCNWGNMSEVFSGHEGTGWGKIPNDCFVSRLQQLNIEPALCSQSKNISMFAHCSLEYVLILHVPVSLCCSIFYFFFFCLLFHALYFCWIVIKWLVGQLNFNNVSFDSNDLKLSILTGLTQKVIISLCSGIVKNPLESCVKDVYLKRKLYIVIVHLLLAAVGCTNFDLYAWAKLTAYTWCSEKIKDLFLEAPAASALSHWWLWPDRIAISVSPLALLFDQWALLSCSGIPCTSQPQLVSLDLRSFFLELVLSSDAVSSGLYQRLLFSLASLRRPAPTHSTSGSASCGHQTCLQVPKHDLSSSTSLVAELPAEGPWAFCAFARLFCHRMFHLSSFT